MPELHLLALRAAVCAGFGVSLHSSKYGSKSVYMLKVGFLTRFVVPVLLSYQDHALEIPQIHILNEKL